MNRNRIIDRPEIKSFLHHCTECLVTSLLWVTWIYLVLPVAIVILWMFGVPFFAQRFFTRGSFQQLYQVLAISGIVLVAILAAEFLWITYNQKLMRKKRSRRRKVPSVRATPLPDMFSVDRDRLAAAKRSRRVEVVREGDGLLRIVRCQGRQRSS